MRAVVEDDFFKFLVEEGLIGDGTLPAGEQGRDRMRLLVEALPPDVLAAARERFARQSPNTVATVVTDPLLHRVIGGCRIEKMLGAGGMGAVYQATQLSIDRPVAFKVQKGAPHPELVERFRSEARLLGKLHSPHIVDVYDVGAADGLQYFVMEFMPGGSLTSYVKKQPDQRLSPADTRRMLIECCLGLAEAAEHGVLHRDIKPDNLLLDGRGTVKIADFGIAKLLDAEYGLTQTGFSPGTPAFKSPEQVAASELDFRTDMYSLGVSFWMLLTGVRPRDSLTRQEQLEQMREPPPFSAPEVAAAEGDPLRLVICRMMALKRADRFATWQELIEALRALPENGAGPNDLAPTVMSRAVPAQKRGSRGALVAAAVIVVGAVGFFAWPRNDASPTDAGRTPPKVTPNDGNRVAEKPTSPPAQPDPEESAEVGKPAEPRTNDGPKQPETAPPSKTEPPKVDTEAPRRTFFAELAGPLPASPRTAAEVATHLQRLRSRAGELGVTGEPAWTSVEQALAKEQVAATARDALRAVKALTTFEQHGELAAAAAKIELPAYRADAEAFVQTLFAERPAFLRVLDADVAALRAWADWELANANVSANAARPLPLVVRDRRRACSMVLLGAGGATPSYLDVAEVSLAQWRASGRAVEGLQGPADDAMPVRNVASADVDAFLASFGARLPTVVEFRDALGTRAGDRFWWGNEAPPQGFVVNLADEARRRESASAPYLPGFDDGVATVAAAADERFAQGTNRAFRHLLGNVAETCVEDGKRVVIGGSFLSSTWDAFAAEQRMPVLNPKRQDIGFRAARDLGR